MGVDIKTEDGQIVREGSVVYDYYDMEPVIIVPGTVITEGANIGWFETKAADGSGTILNGQRICTIGFAAREAKLKKFVVKTNNGERVWQADDEDHAREQHGDAFPDEPIEWVRELIR